MLYRTETPIQGAIFMYDPCVVFVAQRRKIGYVGGQTFVYDPGHYLVLPALMPFECDADGSPEEPFLALSIPLEYDTLAGLINRMGLTNSTAAYRVGYESVPQFSREFKRYFGYTPKESKWNFPIPRDPGV